MLLNSKSILLSLASLIFCCSAFAQSQALDCTMDHEMVTSKPVFPPYLVHIEQRQPEDGSQLIHVTVSRNGVPMPNYSGQGSATDGATNAVVYASLSTNSCESALSQDLGFTAWLAASDGLDTLEAGTAGFYTGSRCAQFKFDNSRYLGGICKLSSL